MKIPRSQFFCNSVGIRIERVTIFEISNKILLLDTTRVLTYIIIIARGYSDRPYRISTYLSRLIFISAAVCLVSWHHCEEKNNNKRIDRDIREVASLSFDFVSAIRTFVLQIYYIMHMYTVYIPAPTLFTGKPLGNDGFLSLSIDHVYITTIYSIIMLHFMYINMKREERKHASAIQLCVLI